MFTGRVCLQASLTPAAARAGQEREARADARAERELDDDAKARAAARIAARAQQRAEREARESVLEEQLESMRVAQRAAQQRRLHFLVEQSALFKDFLRSQGTEMPAASVDGVDTKPESAGTPRRRRVRQDEDLEGEVEAGEESGSGTEAAATPSTPPPAKAATASGMLSPGASRTRLTRQPSVIEFGTMRPYQLEGLNWMINLQENGLNGILADEMGLGKTLQSISVLGYMLQYRHIRGPHLILVPKSTLSNWMAELGRWCPSLRAMQFHGDKATRKEVCETILRPGQRESERTWDVVVTTFEVANIERATLTKWPWQMLIIDEAHRCKNEKSALATTVRMLVVAHRLLLTGTPLQNNLHELWALLNLLLPDVFGDSEAFDAWFDVTVSTSDDTAKGKMIRQLHAVLKPFMLRRLKADVAKSLPPKTETFLYVGMSAMQRDIYRSVLKRDFDAVLTAGGGADAPPASGKRLLNIVMQLRKCCNHPYLFEGVEDRSLPPIGEHLVRHCTKLAVLDKLLQRLRAAGSRVLIFSQMTSMLDILEDYCALRAYRYCRIDGNTSYEDREEGIDAFNAPGSDKFIFLLSTRAGGLGINLATADIVVLYDSDWNPQVDLQAQDRAHRIGQTKPVKVYRLISSDSVEEKIVERAMIKLKLDAVVVQQGRLADKGNRLSKGEMVAMIQYGADNIFRAEASKDGQVSDEDMDRLLAQGQERTRALSAKAEAVGGAKAGQEGSASLLDFKLDSAVTSSVFEGVDYKAEVARSRADRDALADIAALAAAEEEVARNERRTRVGTYNEAAYFKKTTQASMNSSSDPVTRMRGTLKKLHAAGNTGEEPWLPHLHPWQFIDKAAAMSIAQAEADHVEAYVEALAQHKEAVKAAGAEPTSLQPPTYTPFAAAHPDLAEQRDSILQQGFPDWKRSDLGAILEACKRFGREAIDDICSAVPGRTPEEVQRYYNVLWFGKNTVARMQVHPAEAAAGPPGAARMEAAGLGGLAPPSMSEAPKLHGSYEDGKVHELPEGARILRTITRAESKLRDLVTWKRMLTAAVARCRPPLPDVALIEAGKVPLHQLTSPSPAAAIVAQYQNARGDAPSMPPSLMQSLQKPRVGSVGGVFAGGCGSPWDHLPLRSVGRPGDAYTREHDTFLLCTLACVGHGQWRAMRRAILASARWRFDHFFRSRTLAQLRTRCDSLLRRLDKAMPGHLAALKAEDDKIEEAVQSVLDEGGAADAAEAAAVDALAWAAMERLKAARRKEVAAKKAEAAAADALKHGKDLAGLLSGPLKEDLLGYRVVMAAAHAVHRLQSEQEADAVKELLAILDRPAMVKKNGDRPIAAPAVSSVLNTIAHRNAEGQWRLRPGLEWMGLAPQFMYGAVFKAISKGQDPQGAVDKAAASRAKQAAAANAKKASTPPATPDSGAALTGLADVGKTAPPSKAGKRPRDTGEQASEAKRAKKGGVSQGGSASQRSMLEFVSSAAAPASSSK